MSECLAQAVEADLPNDDTILSSGSSDASIVARWNAMLGGLKSPGKWGYYENGYGTTCGVACSAWLDGIAPPSMVNRTTDDGGNGFKPGTVIAKQVGGAKDLKWYTLVKHGSLPDVQRGDELYYTHPGSKGETEEHVGIILSAAYTGAPGDSSGSIDIVTGDGGQNDGHGNQAARRRHRRITLVNGVPTATPTDKLGGVPMAVVGIIRLGGENVA